MGTGPGAGAYGRSTRSPWALIQPICFAGTPTIKAKGFTSYSLQHRLPRMHGDQCERHRRPCNSRRALHLLNTRVPVFVFPANCRAGVVDVGENHAGTTENVVFQDHVVVNRYVVLDLDIVANPNAIASKHVLAERTTITDQSP